MFGPIYAFIVCTEGFGGGHSVSLL